jgi:hypothetical protein
MERTPELHARMITTQIALDRLDEGIKEWSTAQVTTVQQRGFQGNMLLVDRQTGKFVVVSLWQRQADALDSGRGLQEEWDQLFQEGLLTAAPTIEYLEMAASNGRPPS